MKRTPSLIAAFLLAVLAWFLFQYTRADLETAEIDDELRKSAPGQFVKTSGGFVHYQWGGPENGRIVVLVHGFSVPYYLWTETFEMLADAGFRVLRYDLFGRGLSDRPGVKYDSGLFDKQLVELLDALHVQGKVDLAGASMGGPIIAEFACRHPERVRSLAFFDPGYSHGRTAPWKLRMPLLGEYIMAVDIAPGLPESQKNDFDHPDRFPEWPDRFRPQMRFKGFRAAILSTLRNYFAEDWSKSFACAGQGTAPVLLVWGKDDRDVPFETNREVRAAIPRAQFLAVDDAGHVPFLEHPEIVHPAFVQFLRAH
ncbi:MAG: alpha/beta hydrolase [Acidobacteriia bacterium]|nr:alpha/beta hydrolase [Terriglobia bacterium]